MLYYNTIRRTSIAPKSSGQPSSAVDQERLRITNKNLFCNPSRQQLDNCAGGNKKAKTNQGNVSLRIVNLLSFI